ncbi:MAG: hypothetical protein J0H67_23115 [Rhodospirillales bacterium]|nr:hypothetical protein [Rhodospirillales bacterium]MBN8897281.1 hypothetical protein [Rhodospirillales bacterium]
MTDDEYARKLDELDRLLNDPEVSMQPARVWSLLAELSRRDCGVEAMGPPRSHGALGGAAVHAPAD